MERTQQFQSALAAVHAAAHQPPASVSEGEPSLAPGAASLQSRQPGFAESDERAVEMVAERGLSRAEADGVWNARYAQSSILRAEFGSVETYRGFMNAMLARKVRGGGPGSRAALGGTVHQAHSGMTSEEYAAVQSEITKGHGPGSPEMTAMWQRRWESSPALRAEFATKENYSALMNAAAAGRVRIARGKVVG